jgi:hypothetical protein
VRIEDQGGIMMSTDASMPPSCSNATIMIYSPKTASRGLRNSQIVYQYECGVLSRYQSADTHMMGETHSLTAQHG